MIIQGFLENVEIFAQPHFINLSSAIRVRSVLKDEMKEVSLDIFPKFSPGTVAEMPLSDAADQEKAERKLRSVLEALMLYEDRLVKLRYVLRSVGLAKIDYETRFDPQSTPTWRSFVRDHVFPLRFRSKQDLEAFGKYWKKLDEGVRPSFLSMALDRFTMASDAAGVPGMRVHRLLDYVTSLEALLLRREAEASYKLPMRMATLLTDSPKHRLEVFEFVRAVYDIRSRLVHGADMNELRNALPIMLNDKKIELEDALEILHSYCRQCISETCDLILSDMALAKKENLTRSLDRKILTGSIK